MAQNNIQEKLVSTLGKNGLTVISILERKVFLEKDYSIEIENENLFKLKQEGYVIAPFDDILEMCQFIKADIELNEQS